jgi:ubiquinone/menaquinone biosynthesis C-methylase UbiE
MTEQRQAATGTYDPVARTYVERYLHELAIKPFDRERLDAFAKLVRPGGRVLDLGCGPGQVGRYLFDRGLSVTGLDVSEGMLAEARRCNPSMTFIKGDLLDLTLGDEEWAGAVAAYSLIHVPHARLVEVLGSLARALEPRAPVLASFHLGQGVLHAETMFDTPVDPDFFLYRTDEASAASRHAGYEVCEALERDPYPEVEYQGRRVYVLARKP